MAERRPKRVVIVGGGFAGLAAARRLARGFRVTVIDRSASFEFLPNIHELLSGVKTPDLLRLSRARLVERAGHRFVQDEVDDIDIQPRRIQTRSGKRIGWDALILAPGARKAFDGVPGVEMHALPFRCVDDCMSIARRLSELAQTQPGARVVIVGGGLEGVEALGEILRRHRERRRLRVRLVEAGRRLLPEAPAALDRTVRALAAAHGVTFHRGVKVVGVEEGAVVLDSGKRLESALTLWTAGLEAPDLLARAGLAGPHGWAPVRETLQSVYSPRVFVAGDAAERSMPIAKQAYHALDMGEVAGDNAARLLSGRALRTYEPSDKPMLVSFGDLTCFLVTGGKAMSAPWLAAGKELVYQLMMAQLEPAGALAAASATGARLRHAARELLWPTFSSTRALRRQLDVRILALRAQAPSRPRT